MRDTILEYIPKDRENPDDYEKFFNLALKHCRQCVSIASNLPTLYPQQDMLEKIIQRLKYLWETIDYSKEIMECDNEIWTVFWYKNQINPDFIKNKKSKRIFEEKDSCVSLYKYVDKIQKYYIDR